MKALRVVQALVGLAILAHGVAAQSWIGLFGLLPLYAAITGVCPACARGGSCALPETPEHQDK